jgi:putative ABC transport system permease protein
VSASRSVALPKARDAYRFSFALPLAFLSGSYLRLALAVVALAIAVATVGMVDLVNRAVLLAFVEVAESMAGRASLQVSAGDAGLFPEAVADAVAKVPGVRLAVPVVVATAFTPDEHADVLTVLGVDLTNESAVRVYETSEALLSGSQGPLAIDDPLVFLNQPDSIALTRELAERRGLSVGESIPLDTPSGRRSFTVRGILESHGLARALGGNLAVMDILAAQAVFTKPAFVNRIDIVAARDTDPSELARAVDAVLPDGIRATPPEFRKADLTRVIRSFQLLLWGVALILLVVCFLIAFNRLATHFEARAWQAGTLRAVGVRRAAVWRELLKESLVVGGLGVVLGLPLGVALGRWLLPLIANAAVVNFKLVAPKAELDVRVISLVIATIVGLGAAVMAAWLPTWRAARVPVAETMRRRGVEQVGATPWTLWVVRGLLLTTIGTTIVVQLFAESPIWGLVATVLIAAGTVLAAAPLLQLLRAPLGPIVEWLAGPTGPFAWSAVWDNRRRTALTIGMMGVGLGSVLWLSTMAKSIEETFIYAQTGAVRAELIVASSHVASGWVFAPVDESLMQDLQRIDGVAAVAGNRLLEWPYEGESIALDVFDADYLRSERFGRWMLVDRSDEQAVWERVASGSGIVVSTNFVLHFKKGIGDDVVLNTPTGPLAIPIVGISMVFASPTGTVHMSRELFTRRWNDHQLNRIWVRTTPGTPLATVRASISRSLGSKYRLRMFSAQEMVDYWVAQVRRAFAGIGVLRVLVLVALLLGVADTLVAGLMQRTREIGVARSIGARRGHLQRMVVVEGVVLGALGLLLAAAMGLVLGWLWVRMTLPQLLGYVVHLHMPVEQILLVAVTAMIVCVVAALLPARQAASLAPASALRYE